MSDVTLHSPEQIVQQMLIDNGFGDTPGAAADWPVYYAHLPDAKGKQVIGVISTDGIKDGRIMRDNIQDHEGIQVICRGKRLQQSPPQTKAREIAQYFDTLSRVTVSIDGTDYLVQAISRISPVLGLGLDGTGKTLQRYSFAINATITVEEV